MDFFPIFLNLKNSPCLVVGGGEVAFRKVSALLQAGAAVTVVSPELCAAFNELATIRHLPEPFRVAHLHDASLVIAATDDATVNKEVSMEARKRKLPVNVVDNPEL